MGILLSCAVVSTAPRASWIDCTSDRAFSVLDAFPTNASACAPPYGSCISQQRCRGGNCRNVSVCDSPIGCARQAMDIRPCDCLAHYCRDGVCCGSQWKY